MGKSKPIASGTQTFDSKSAARKAILTVRDRHPLLTPIDGPDHDFLLAVLSLHTDAVGKVGVGVKHFTVEKNIGGTHGHGDHAKPAIDDQVKSGHREKA